MSLQTINLKDNRDNKFKRTAYCNQYKSKIEDVTQAANNTTFRRTLLDTSIPGVNRLFVAAFPNDPTRNTHGKYFIPATNIKEYKILIDRRNFYDQNISDDFKKYK